MLPSWWRSLFALALGKGNSPRREGLKKRKPRASYRAAVEQLEDRLAPVISTVRLGNVLTPPPGQGGRGQVVSVPIVVDQLHDNQTHIGDGLGEQIGIGGGTFVIYYDSRVFSQINNITLGVLALPGGGPDPLYSTSHGWGLTQTTDANIPGYAKIPYFSGGMRITTADSGTLAILNFQVMANAPLGLSHIDLVADTGGNGHNPHTQLDDGDDGVGGRNPYNLGPNPNSPGGIVNADFFPTGPLDSTGDVQIITFAGNISPGSTFKLAAR